MSNILVLCDGAEQSNTSINDSFDKTIRISQLGKKANLMLAIEHIAFKILSTIDPVSLDLIELASFIYTADTSVKRGTSEDIFADKWVRNFTFVIPCRNPHFWNSTEVKDKLCEILEFLSEDRFRFDFIPWTPQPEKQYLKLYGDERPYKNADCVALFSGGLDSLSGVIDDCISGCKPLLVSHNSRSTMNRVQKDLRASLHQKFPQWDFPHLSLCVHRSGEEKAKEYTQRTRSFLYFSLACLVAYQCGLNTVRFYENGEISINIPLLPQNIGALLTRTTHPKFIKDFSHFAEIVFKRKFELINPFIFMTKGEVAKKMDDNGCGELIGASVSCAHTWKLTKLHNHCGTCSQCVDRRFAIESMGLTHYDTLASYQNDFFLDEIDDKYGDKACVVGYVRTALDIDEMNIDQFRIKYSELSDCVCHFDLFPLVVYEKLFDLFRRLSGQVMKVLKSKMAENLKRFVEGSIPKNSLLYMIGSGKHLLNDEELSQKKTSGVPHSSFPTPPSTKWEQVFIQFISDDSIKITVGKIAKRYHYAEIGFKDRRKHTNESDTHWKLLQYLASHNGEISAENYVKECQKKIQTIRSRLKIILNLSDDPFYLYRKEKMYRTRFLIEHIHDSDYKTAN